LSDSTALADIELANWDSSEAMSEAESGDGGMRAERTAAEFRSKGTQVYLTASLAPSLCLDTEPCRYGTSPAAFERHWLKARSAPAEGGKATILSEIHFRASYFYSYLETRGLGCMAEWTMKPQIMSPN
jgi:hypothetical protein